MIAWSEYHGTNDARIHAAARPANGTFKALPDLRKAARLSDVEVAMSPAGHATVAWTRRSSAELSPYLVEAASRGVSGDFGPVDRVSNPAIERAEGPHLGLNVSGDNTAYAVWHGEDGWYAAVRPAGSAFGAAGRIPNSSAGDTAFGRALVAPAPDGSALAVWTANMAGAPRGVQSARLQPDGTIGTTEALAVTAPPAGFYGYHEDAVALGVDDQGNAATIWRYHEYPAPGIGGDYTIRSQLERFDAAPPAFDSVEVPATADRRAARDDARRRHRPLVGDEARLGLRRQQRRRGRHAEPCVRDAGRLRGRGGRGRRGDQRPRGVPHDRGARPPAERLSRRTRRGLLPRHEPAAGGGRRGAAAPSRRPPPPPVRRAAAAPPRPTPATGRGRGRRG